MSTTRTSPKRSASQPAPRAPMTSGTQEKRRSVPSVEALPPRVREQLTAAALTSNRAQLNELKLVHAEVRAQRKFFIATIASSSAVAVAMIVIAVVGAVRISSAERRIDSVERRLERIEKTVFVPETQEK